MASERNDIALSFNGALNLQTIETMRRTLLEALNGSTSVAIDCTAAESVDLSFIQLLLAARLSADKAGKRLELAMPLPDVLRAALVQGGFLSPGRPAAAIPLWNGGT
jgi:anti-anti-sigma regulatory factor